MMKTLVARSVVALALVSGFAVSPASAEVPSDVVTVAVVSSAVGVLAD